MLYLKIDRCWFGINIWIYCIYSSSWHNSPGSASYITGSVDSLQRIQELESRIAELEEALDRVNLNFLFLWKTSDVSSIKALQP